MNAAAAGMIGVVVFCLSFLFSAQAADRAALPLVQGKQERVAETPLDALLREHLIRKVIQRRGSAQLWFVDYSKTQESYLQRAISAMDPPAGLLQSLRQDGFDVRPISEAYQTNGLAITDAQGTQNAWIVYARIIRWIDKDTAEFECGDCHGLEAASSLTGTIAFQDGAWVILNAKLGLS